MHCAIGYFFFIHKLILRYIIITMQKIATKIFIYASVTFGVLGVFMALSGIDPDQNGSGFEMVLGKLFMASVFIILTSFALSVAGKYLNGK